MTRAAEIAAACAFALAFAWVGQMAALTLSLPIQEVPW
jgi:hypothetical protein